MSNAIDGLKNAGQAVKDGFEHIGDVIEKELGDKPTQEAAPASPDGCGPTHCDEPTAAQA
ncbi:MAG TPA: hypothetical protein VGN81_17345 [Pseudonocardiaceae bacterium]